MIVRVVAVVPAAYCSAVQAAIAPFLSGSGSSEFGVALSPLGQVGAQPTHFATCTCLDTENSHLLSRLPQLLAQVPGGAYQVVPLDQWFHERDWVAWIANRGLAETKPD